MSIFVSIAAYRDDETADTIDSLVKNSTHDLHVSVVQQCHKNEYVDTSQWEDDRVKITNYWMRPGNAKGAGYARKLALLPFKNEDYFVQIDSHTQFVQNWDSKMIATLNWAMAIDRSNRVILSQFPAGYTRNELNEIEILKGHSKYPDTPQKQKPKVNGQGQIVAQRLDKQTNGPELSTTLLAGYIFAPGDFALLGYDENIIFWGEEFMLAISAWMNGWRIYSPPEIYMYHHYGRRGRVRVWKDLSKWSIMDYESQEYQASVFRELMDSPNYHLLHDEHREVIEGFLDYRGELAKQSYTETGFFSNNIVYTEIVNGKPTQIK